MKFFYQENARRFQLEAETPDDAFKLGQLTVTLADLETCVTVSSGKIVLSAKIDRLIDVALKVPAIK